MSTRLQLQEAFKIALSVALFYWFTLSVDWAMPKYGVLAIVVVSTSTVGDSLLKGVMRSVGTIIGAVIGLVIVSLFAQNQLGLMLAIATMLVVISYFGQTSRHQYAWVLVTIVMIIVWATAYGNPHGTFHFAVFRTLETICGILVYTVVSAVLWPITAEDRLMAEGRGLWLQIAELGRRLRRQLAQAGGAMELTEVRHQIAGSLMHLEHSLPALYADTWATVSRKPIWECLRASLRSLVEEMDHWRLIVQDFGELDMERHLPGLDAALATLQARFEQSGKLWDADGAEGDDEDKRLLEPLSLEEVDVADLSPSNRAALALLVESLGAVDRASREVLRCLRTLADLDPTEDFSCQNEPAPLRRPSLWSIDRLLNSLLPAVCWLVGFNLWIAFNIPGGAIVALLAAVLGVLMTFHPLPLLELLKWILVAVWFVVGPIYLFVLPHLNSSASLLTIIFLFFFVFAMVGAKNPILKLAAMALFPLVIDISNHQVYSFIKLAVMSMIIVFGVAITFLTDRLLRTLGPMGAMKRELRRFFAACARIVEGFHLHEIDEDQRRRVRHISFQNRILPAPQRLQGIAAQFASSDLPEETAGELGRLVDGAEVLGLRLEAIDYAHETAVGGDSKLGALMEATSEKLGEKVQAVFECWSQAGEDQLSELDSIEEDLNRQIESMQTVADDGGVSADELRRFFMLTGSLRGLLSTMSAINLAYVPVREFLNESSQ